VAGGWFSRGTPVSPTEQTHSHHITEILLKVALNTRALPYNINMAINSTNINKTNEPLNSDGHQFNQYQQNK
jgi:hypothetical protein